MFSQIQNQACLTYRHGNQKDVSFSNLASVILQSPITVSKTSLNNSYYIGDEIVYVLTIKNNMNSNINQMKIRDDLGSYCLNNNPVPITPLDFVGIALLFIDGVFSTEITPAIHNSHITFRDVTIPPKSSAMLIFKTKVNTKAQFLLGSYIKSTTTFHLYEHIDNSETICTSLVTKVSEKADVQIVKSMHPSPILNGDEITYNFIIYNYGNLEATDVIIKDEFNPIPIISKVILNSCELMPSDYNFKSGTFTIPASQTQLPISIPASEFLQNQKNGITTINPGMASISIIGTL